MSGEGLQRVCPRCGELNYPDAERCRDCGKQLLPRLIEGAELAQVREDWHKIVPPFAGDPQLRLREAEEWDRKRLAEEHARAEHEAPVDGCPSCEYELRVMEAIRAQRRQQQEEVAEP